MEKNTTIVFPAPLMSTVQELGSFLTREQTATAPAGRVDEIQPARNGSAVVVAPDRG